MIHEMPILQDSSPELRKNLLDLFSVASLREAFKAGGLKKGEIIKNQADSDDQTQIDTVAQFIDDYLETCKQHVYVFEGQTVLPTTIFSGEPLGATGSSTLFVTEVNFDVFTLSPPTQNSVSFLWPVRVEMIETYLVVRFITLEKSMSALFGESIRVIGRSLSEESILEDWGLTTGLRADLNKGVKALWATDWFDCTKGRYKKSYSVSQDSMDAGRGIKGEYPEVYEAMMLAPIQNSVFELKDSKFQSLAFSVDPTDGRIRFPTYTSLGVTDAVIQRIIAANC